MDFVLTPPGLVSLTYIAPSSIEPVAVRNEETLRLHNTIN